MIIGNCHVQRRLQIDTAHWAGQGCSLLWQGQSFLCLQVGVGTLLQELCSEVGQATPTGCVQWSFSLNRNKWPTSDHFQAGSYLPSLSAETQVPKCQTQPWACPVTSWPHDFCAIHPGLLSCFFNVLPSTLQMSWLIFYISNDLPNHPSFWVVNHNYNHNIKPQL